MFNMQQQISFIKKGSILTHSTVTIGYTMSLISQYINWTRKYKYFNNYSNYISLKFDIYAIYVSVKILYELQCNIHNITQVSSLLNCAYSKSDHLQSKYKL